MATVRYEALPLEGMETREGEVMQTVDEVVSALDARIRQLDQALEVLNEANGPFQSRAIMDAVKEELETLMKWVNSTSTEMTPGDKP
jgi:hypothetical protein